LQDVPIYGTLRRCAHGIYLPPGQETSAGCQACNPPAPLTPAEKERAAAFQFPNSGDPLNDHDKTLATRDKGSCPACGSRLHFAFKKNWECAECGHLFSVPRGYKKKLRLEKLRVEAVCV
jgi:ribosomal protein S27AE